MTFRTPLVVAALPLFAALTACTVEVTDGAATGGPLLPYVPSNVGDITAEELPAAEIVGRCVVGAKSRTDVFSTCEGLPEGNARFVRVGDRDVLTFVVGSLRVAPGATLTLDGAFPVVFVVAGAATVDGTITLAARDQDATAGSAAGLDQFRSNGAVGAGTPASKASAVGGAGGSFCGLGGGAAAASTYGTASLVPLLPGAPGGSGYSSAGAGGGALQISARTLSIGAAGIVEAGGGPGNFGSAGGGSGGGVLLEAVHLVHRGTIAANGGGGGSTNGDGGEASRPDGLAAKGGVDRTGNVGGIGSSVDAPSGEPGALGADGASPSLKGIPGGGGGGAGRIRINVASAAPADGSPFGAEATGVLSPSAATGCMTFGVVQAR